MKYFVLLSFPSLSLSLSVSVCLSVFLSSFFLLRSAYLFWPLPPYLPLTLSCLAISLLALTQHNPPKQAALLGSSSLAPPPSSLFVSLSSLSFLISLCRENGDKTISVHRSPPGNNNPQMKLNRKWGPKKEKLKSMFVVIQDWRRRETGGGGGGSGGVGLGASVFVPFQFSFSLLSGEDHSALPLNSKQTSLKIKNGQRKHLYLYVMLSIAIEQTKDI